MRPEAHLRPVVRFPIGRFRYQSVASPARCTEKLRRLRCRCFTSTLPEYRRRPSAHIHTGYISPRRRRFSRDVSDSSGTTRSNLRQETLAYGARNRTSAVRKYRLRPWVIFLGATGADDEILRRDVCITIWRISEPGDASGETLHFDCSEILVVSRRASLAGPIYGAMAHHFTGAFAE